MIVEDAINQVLNTGHAVFIPCKDAKQQESIRVTAFHRKTKVLFSSEMIGITKFTSVDGALFVKIHKKEVVRLMVMNEQGELVPLEVETTNSDLSDMTTWKRKAGKLEPELQRIISLLQKRGASEEDIDQYVAEWDAGVEEPITTPNLPPTIDDLPFPQDIQKREKLGLEDVPVVEEEPTSKTKKKPTR